MRETSNKHQKFFLELIMFHPFSKTIQDIVPPIPYRRTFGVRHMPTAENDSDFCMLYTLRVSRISFHPFKLPQILHRKAQSGIQPKGLPVPFHRLFKVTQVPEVTRNIRVVYG